MLTPLPFGFLPRGHRCAPYATVFFATRLVTTALLAAGVTLACSKAAPPPPPPPEVSVVTIAPKTVEDNIEFSGQVQAFRTVQVRAQASGVITARPFTEGAQVHMGDVLYRIDPTTSDAALRSAQARFAEAQARLSNAVTVAGRLRPLLQGNAVAKQDVDNAESQVLQARASVEDARGGLEAARKGVSETTVRAEIGGRVGRTLLDVGARVTGPGDVLTTIDVLDPVYVSFRPSAEQQFDWRRDPAQARALAPGGSARVEAIMPDGSVFPSEGRIGFIDPVVDAQTGTQEYRAEFPNPNHLMLPGQFVHVRLRGLVRQAAIVIPQRAVVEQMGRQIVYVVGAGNKVATREVHATSWSGNDWLIAQGLAPGDRVIVDGVQKVGPGAVVRPTPLVDSTSAGISAGTNTPTAASASAPASAPAPTSGR